MNHGKRKANIACLFVWGLSLCVLLNLFVYQGKAQEAQHVRQKNILLLYDEQERLPGLALLDQSIRSALNSDPSIKLEIFSESLDRSRFPDGSHNGFLRDYFKRKYSNRKLDVIVSVMGPSLDFLLENANEFAPGTPIVFCGVDRREIQSRTLGPNMSGVLVRRDFAGTLRIALDLQPKTRKAVFIAGASDFDKRLIVQAKQELAEFEGRVEIEYVTNFELSELLERVSKLPPDTIILNSTVFNDNTGKAFVPHEVVALVSKQACVPVYGFLDQFLGRGIVGGHLYSLEEHGKTAGEIALRVLKGESPADIPMIEADTAQDMFDWRELQRWDLDENKLPAGSIVRYRVSSVWELYRGYILTALVIGFLQTLLISWLLIIQSRRRNAELERSRFQTLVTTEHQKLDAVLANVPVIVWESRIEDDSNDRRIVFISDYVEKKLGYTPEEIMATPNFWRTVIVKEDAHKLRETTLNIVAGKGKGGQQFRCKTKSGAIIWIDVYLDAIWDDKGIVVGLRGVAVDVTDRKESEEAILYLGAKLIDAQEEERSRVARELHDGLSQSLALLSIQLGELDRYSGGPAIMRKKVEHFRSMIQRLSSDLHRISHKLHPATLEQLGLESALEGICREISEAHNMDIEFEAKDVPRVLPKNVSLCLYRVTQESLQNVRKHSGALSAGVKISVEKDFINLTVSDNGIGFDPSVATGKESLGLVSMRERIRSVKGTFAVKSTPGAGTQITVRVPAV